MTKFTKSSKTYQKVHEKINIDVPLIGENKIYSCFEAPNQHQYNKTSYPLFL